MQKVRNRLLIATVLFAIAASACLHGRAEARGTYLGRTTFNSLKPVAGAYSGEPDSGDTGKTPRGTSGTGGSGSNGTSGGSPIPPPSGFIEIIAAWAARYLGTGW